MTTTSPAPTLLWFRQDLRLADQAAVTAAAAEGPVLAVYVLDDDAPGDWRIGGAQRWWLHHALTSLAASLDALGVPLVLRRGDTVAIITELADAVGAARVHCLAHYEPWWRDTEARLGERLELVRHDGYLLADPDTVRTGAGTGFRVFAPFWKALQLRMPPAAPVEAPQQITGVAHPPAGDELAAWGLLPMAPDWSGGFGAWQPGEEGAHASLEAFVDHVGGYAQDRNLPSIDGSSRLSPHLHMGEISPATVWHAVATSRGAEPFLRELAWRDFTSNLIVQLPRYADDNGRARMDDLRWRSGPEADADFVAWTRGETGYPIVDAGMRQLWQLGWMHNRVRMLTASFLIKHLLLDWRRGERWFWDCLIDADYGNNSVNWQWVAGTGVDSAPFNRIMAPLGQSEKFDAAGYIRHWVPELAGLGDATIHDPHGAGVAPAAYAPPLIGHREARERALAALRRVGAQADSA
jgi:deoxyribodipyrimidine photo-lyase